MSITEKDGKMPAPKKNPLTKLVKKGVKKVAQKQASNKAFKTARKKTNAEARKLTGKKLVTEKDRKLVRAKRREVIAAEREASKKTDLRRQRDAIEDAKRRKAYEREMKKFQEEEADRRARKMARDAEFKLDPYTYAKHR